jgi:hypothetical protein
MKPGSATPNRVIFDITRIGPEIDSRFNRNVVGLDARFSFSEEHGDSRLD